ncbi:MAG: response regulator transcription factor [Ahrensia sp.]|nr:response regulator transcription factor [Ahrensia sp.]
MRILILDDHPLFREAFRSAIESACSSIVVVEAETHAQGLDRLAEDSQFDLIMLDLSVPDTKGYFGLSDLRARYPKIPIGVVSGHEEPRVIKDVMAQGALGFIPKSTRRPDLIKAVMQILDGEIFLPPDYCEPQDGADDAQRSLLLQRVASLTPQQLRVLNMLRDGLLNKQIAYELDVGETTVKAHVSEILRKLGVHSRTQVVIEIGKIDIDGVWDSISSDQDS